MSINQMTNFTPRQCEIINTAMEIIAKHGFAELSINKISTNIGIKESSIYNHFESKKAILNGIFHFYKDHVIKTLESVENIDSSYLEAIKTYFFIICAHIKDNPCFIKLLIREFYHYDPYFKENYISLLVSSLSRFINIIEKAKENNEIKKNIDNDCIISMFWGSIDTIAREKFMFPDFDLDENSNRIWQFIERTISTG